MLNLQDPLDPNSKSLLEALAGSSCDASSGIGVFAFASRLGVDALMLDSHFGAFVKRYPFMLIVGLDAVTNTEALDCIKKHVARNKRLVAKAWLHHRRGSLFHPKFCVMTGARGGTVIVGSGNLTPGGLSSNWEAFSERRLGRASVPTITRILDSWKARNRAFLFDLDDSDVRAAAKANKLAPMQRSILADSEGVAPYALSQSTVLIAEIPRASDRWNQANFDLDTYREFFGLQPGVVARVTLWLVDDAGKVLDIEIRPAVSVKSQNYRIELGAAASRPYPSSGAPIGVFVRVGSRAFRYQLLMPGDRHYAEYSALLASRAQAKKKGGKLRARFSIAEVAASVPGIMRWSGLI